MTAPRDLRAAVEGLQPATGMTHGEPPGGHLVTKAEVLALIPPRSVVVTAAEVEALEVIHDRLDSVFGLMTPDGWDVEDTRHGIAQGVYFALDDAARLLARLQVEP